MILKFLEKVEPSHLFYIPNIHPVSDWRSIVLYPTKSKIKWMWHVLNTGLSNADSLYPSAIPCLISGVVQNNSVLELENCYHRFYTVWFNYIIALSVLECFFCHCNIRVKPKLKSSGFRNYWKLFRFFILLGSNIGHFWSNLTS